MEAILKEKLQQTTLAFSNQETTWLMENIGHPDGQTRDGIVYLLLARGLGENAFTKEQFHFLTQQTIEQDLIFYHINEGLPATVTRTFAALLNGMLLDSDNRKDSRYHQLLTNQERDYFFQRALAYLNEEQDFTGHSESYGWVHGFAHGADFLLYALLHQDFPEELKPEVFSTIARVFLRLPEAFIAGEERRLATVIYQAIQNGVLSAEATAAWIDQLEFPLVELVDFQRLAAFENFLAAIYFHLIASQQLAEGLRHSLMNYLKDY
ncbi:DUF2785 domain-containing protein [Enterococcus sp. HY326]|uniref:DUF2785 domain-containing protein n=1 Tax=Enterococcus sp. HY326 TaxID=2971265 RepID=UPI002240CAC6|nr:DUF2785 domain-containing protein [Enterococcus sp. HY326]